MMTKAFLILEDGTVFEGKSMGAQKEVISINDWLFGGTD